MSEKVYKIYQDKQQDLARTYPDFYIRFFNIKDDQIILDNNTIDYYGQLMKMSCEKKRLKYRYSSNKHDYYSNIVYFEDIELFGCAHVNLDMSLTFYLDLAARNDAKLAWKRIIMEASYYTEILSAVKRKNGDITFTLITAEET